MVSINIKVDDHGLASAFAKKAGETNAQFNKFSRDLVDIAHRWVQNEAPRKTGKLKASVQKGYTGNGGYVFVSKALCKYADYVIDGTRPHDITPKSKRALNVPGYGVFKKVHHPGTKSNPFVDKAVTAMDGDIERRIAIFEQWLGDV